MISTRSARGGIVWKFLVLLALLFMMAVAYLLRAPLLATTASLLVVDEKLSPADAIIVLGDDNYAGDRARHAAKLYRERWAPRVVASGRYIRPYASVADLIRRDLLANGVADEHIVMAGSHANSTRSEAFEMRRVIREQRWRRVIVVTSNYHTRRARYIFSRALDADTQLLVSSAPDSDFDLRSWWQSRGSLKMFLRETMAWPVAIWEMSGNSNPPAPQHAPSAPGPASAPAPASARP